MGTREDNGDEVETKEIIRVQKVKNIFACDLCDKTFPRNHYLKNHIVLNHTHEYRCHCQYCNKGFYMESQKRKHEKHVHLKLKPYKYQKKEKKDKFTCSYCGSKFDCNVFLQDHIVNMHTKEYKYFCEWCEKGFYLKSKRDFHVRLVHLKTVTVNRSVPISKPKAGNSVSCPMEGCQKVICSRHNLKIHMKSHQNQKYICEFCSKIFTSHMSLTRHLKTHTEGPMSFVCDVCEKSLTTRSALIYHKRIHTGERPAQCEHCGRGFVCNRDLNVHRGRFHHDLQIKYICRICKKKFQVYGKLKQHYTQYHPEDEIPDENADLP